jgi:hypothetical protein
MIAAGTYKNTNPSCWSDFTLSESGSVVFTDAGDGHKVYYNATPDWLAEMGRWIADGRLVLVSP